MKVLIVYSTASGGGAERSLTRMAAACTSIEYVFVVADTKGPVFDLIKSKGFPVYSLPSPRSATSTLKFLWKLRRLIHNEEIDLIYLCGLRVATAARLARRLGYLPNTRLVHAIRSNINGRELIDRAYRLCERMLRNQTDGWITNSAAASRTLIHEIGLDPSRVFTIHNGIDVQEYRVHRVRSSHLNIVVVANIQERKGQIEFVNVFRQVHAAEPRARVYFVGRDDMKGQLQKVLAENGLESVAHVVGFQDNMTSWYDLADLVVLPSLGGEGCPTALLEAMASGLPTVAYRIDGIPEVVTHNESGLLVELGNAGGMTSAILSLLADDEQRHLLGDAGRKRMVRDFNPKSCATDHSNVFSQIYHGV